jgi:hypothetical protein
MVVTKKHLFKLVVVAVLLWSVYHIYSYFGLRSRLDEASIARSEAKAKINSSLHNSIQEPLSELDKGLSPEAADRIRRQIELKNLVEDRLYSSGQANVQTGALPVSNSNTGVTVINPQTFVVQNKGNGLYKFWLDQRINDWSIIAKIKGPARIEFQPDPNSRTYTVKGLASPNGLGTTPGYLLGEVPAKNCGYYALAFKVSDVEVDFRTTPFVDIPEDEDVIVYARGNVPPSHVQETVAAHLSLQGFSGSIQVTEH